MTALDAKRMQTFFNEFTKTTYTFLNSFVQDCENKFFILDRKLQKIETSLLLVEAKLSNSSETTANKPINEAELKPTEPIEQNEIVEESPKKTEIEAKSDVEPQEQEPPPNENMIKISESATYKKYFMMLKVGIPLMAVKQKLHSEGLECDLENPNLMINKEEEE